MADDETQKLNEPTRPGPLPGGPYFLLAMTATLVLAAVFVPEDVVLSLAEVFETPAAQTDSFDAIVVKLDDALTAGEPLPVSRAGFAEYHHLVAARRLAGVGRATGEELRRASAIFDDFRVRIASEESEGSKDAMRKLRDETLDEALPRVELAAITEAMALLRAQVERAEFAGAQSPSKAEAPQGAAMGECGTCHLELVDFDGPPLDLAHLWPDLDAEQLGGGTKLPTMMAAAETDDCASCHEPHESPDFGVSDEMRADNVGMWVHVSEFEGLIRAQVKVQNIEASHRIPAGAPEHAYAIAVSAAVDGEPLTEWWGMRLPERLSDLGTAGLFLGRDTIDSAGEYTSIPSEIAGIQSDTRLEPKRFYDEYFLFQAPAEGVVTVTATVWYLPNAGEPSGRKIQVAKKELRVQGQ